MSEPLTKICDCADGTMCIEKHVDLDKLKNALEEFERLIGNSEKGTYISTMAMLEVRTALKKAFPAILKKWMIR